MDGSYRIDESAIPLGYGRLVGHVARLREQVRALAMQDLTGQGLALGRAIRTAPDKVSPYLTRLGPSVRAYLVFLGVSVAEEEAAEPTPEQNVLSAFDALDREQQKAVARNLSLLWECFVEEFNGLSGFYQASPTRQAAYLAKLEAAAARMEAIRVPEARYHFVSVALMKHYASSFQTRSTDPSAIELSHRVAALIDGCR